MRITDLNDPNRLIPVGGDNDWAHHPGFEQSDCDLRYTVSPPVGSVASSRGFACIWTGGHCLPCDQCDQRQTKWRKQNEQSE